jgi:hypothetical protein
MFVQIENTSELHGLPAGTRIRVNGVEKTIGDYADLVVAGTPLLEAMAMLGQSIQIEKAQHVHTDECPTWNGYPTHSPAHCPSRDGI